MSDVSPTPEPRDADAAPGPCPRWMRVLMGLLAVWVAFTFAFTPLRTSHDEWWHLKSGQYIWENGLPENDIFTYTAAEIPWHNHEWVTQIGMWLTWRAGEASGFGGVRAVIALKTVFIVLAFAGFGLLLGRRMREPVWWALAGAMGAALARRTSFPRPPFVSYLLLALALWLFIEWRAGRLRERWLWVLVPVFALWSNLHGGWMAGLLIIGAFWADEAFGVGVACLRGDNMRGRLLCLARLTGLGLACVIGTLANPYGYKLYALAGRVMADEYLISRIGEMMPADWHFVLIVDGVILAMAAAAVRPVRVAGWIATAVLLAAITVLLRFSGPLAGNPWLYTALAVPVLIVAIARSGAPGRVALILLNCFFAYQGIHHIRHLSLWAVMLIPALAWALAGWSEALAAGARPGRVWRIRPQVIGLAVLALLAGFWTLNTWRESPSQLRRNLMLVAGAEAQPAIVDTTRRELPAASSLPEGMFLIDQYPVKAVNFLLRARLPQPFWNGGNYAGYLMWRLAPETGRLFTDNRYDIYGGQFIKQEHSVLDGYTAEELATNPAAREMGFMAWDEVLDQWDVQTVFVPVEKKINLRLEASPDWTRVWEDYAFSLWVRDTPANRAVIDKAAKMGKPNPWLEILWMPPAK